MDSFESWMFVALGLLLVFARSLARSVKLQKERDSGQTRGLERAGTTF